MAEHERPFEAERSGSSASSYRVSDVVSDGLCVGCGACSVATSGTVFVELDKLGIYQADLGHASPEELAAADSVCPFSDSSPNEDVLSASLFDDSPHLTLHPGLGYTDTIFAGRVADDSSIAGSSSGGMTTWILSELLSRKMVDAVIHVGATGQPGSVFAYQVSDSVEELQGKRKSAYYSTSYADVVNQIRGDGRRYAFVGVPCFVRSLRSVLRTDEVLRAQLVYLIGIVCGHLKSGAYAESLAWQMGIQPDDLEAVDFRVKDPKRSSRHYGFGAKARGDAEQRVASSGSLLGVNWGHAVFQLDACNYCDDIYAETADFVLGDAWIPRYESDWRGTNVVLSRRPELDALLADGLRDGSVVLDKIDESAALGAQAGNFRHRHQGLAIRLADDDAAGRKRPTKRVAASYEVAPARRQNVVRQRRALSKLSHRAFADAKAAGDLDVYLRVMKPAIRRYDRHAKPSVPARAWRRLKQTMWKVGKKVR